MFVNARWVSLYRGTEVHSQWIWRIFMFICMSTFFYFFVNSVNFFCLYWKVFIAMDDHHSWEPLPRPPSVGVRLLPLALDCIVWLCCSFWAGVCSWCLPKLSKFLSSELVPLSRGWRQSACFFPPTQRSQSPTQFGCVSPSRLDLGLTTPYCYVMPPHLTDTSAPSNC